MEHGVNTNLLFKWRRALRAGEYDPVGLLPVTVEAPTQETARPAPIATQAVSTAALGAIEINVGSTRVRIEGSPNEATLRLVLRMLRDTSERPA
jgi:transposase